MTTKHTPGPWHVGDLAAPNLAGRNALVYAPSGYAVADAKVFHCKFGVPEMEANARLIAAAPDMLEALEGLLLVEPTTRSDLAWEMLTIHEKARRYDQALERIKSAIAKARGEDA